MRIRPLRCLLLLLVSLAVSGQSSPELVVSQALLSLDALAGGAPVSTAIELRSSATARLEFNVSSSAPWLTVTTAASSLPPGATAAVLLTADPASLAPGSHHATLTIQSPTAATVSLPVRLEVAAARRKLLLSQSGLTLFSTVGGGAPQSQTFGILNIGRDPLPYRLSVQDPAGRPVSWIQLSKSAGTVTRPYLDVETVEVTADPSGLSSGDYYARILVTTDGAVNSPQSVTVLLSIRPAGTLLPPHFSPTGIVFTTPLAANPPAQNLRIGTTSRTSLSYNSTPVFIDGDSWFTHAPLSGTLSATQAAGITVTPSLARLASGVYRGVISFQFSGAQTAIVRVLSVVAPAPAAAAVFGRAATACVPSSLEAEFTNLPSGFTTRNTDAVPIELQIVDNCGQPVTTGAVVATFGNGDTPVPLVHTGGGRWTGTWQPLTVSATPVTVRAVAVAAVSAGASSRGAAQGSAQTSGQVQAGGGAPLVRRGAVLNSGSYVQDSVAPGGLISIFGSGLANTRESAASVPLPTVLGGTEIVIGGRPVPLLYASENQVNALLPFDVEVNSLQEIVVRRGTTLSVPQAVSIAAAQPAIFTVDQSGRGRGVIVNGLTNRLITPESPAAPGDTIVVYATGLGAVDPPVPTGQAGGPSTALAAVALSIGGLPAEIKYAGLTPGSPGLYQVNAVVPAAVPSGVAQVLLVAAGQRSLPVDLSVRRPE